MAKKIIKLTESDLINIVKKVVSEQEQSYTKPTDSQVSKLPFITNQTQKNNFLDFNPGGNDFTSFQKWYSLVKNQVKDSFGFYNNVNRKRQESVGDKSGKIPYPWEIRAIHNAIDHGLNVATITGWDPNNKMTAQNFMKAFQEANPKVDPSFFERFKVFDAFKAIFNEQKNKVSKG